jgi:hypothetical protein
MNERNERIKTNQWSYLLKYIRAQKISYDDYLKTAHWKDVRKKYWNGKLHNKTCYVCGSKNNLQVHHKSYRRIGHEYLRDLCLLCNACHKETHRLERERPCGILFGATKRARKNFLISVADNNIRRE